MKHLTLYESFGQEPDTDYRDFLISQLMLHVDCPDLIRIKRNTWMNAVLQNPYKQYLMDLRGVYESPLELDAYEEYVDFFNHQPVQNYRFNWLVLDFLRFDFDYAMKPLPLVAKANIYSLCDNYGISNEVAHILKALIDPGYSPPIEWSKIENTATNEA